MLKVKSQCSLAICHCSLAINLIGIDNTVDVAVSEQSFLHVLL